MAKSNYKIKISVIIVNWNGQHLLGDCLSALANQSYKNFELILVDNGSKDNSGFFVQNNFPWVNILKLDKNYGFGCGNNRGIEIAGGEYIAFLNNDTKVDKDWLLELVKILDVRKEVGFCSSKMLFYDNKNLLDNVGIGYLKSGVGYKIGWLEKDVGQYDNQGYVFGACCGAGIFRRSVLDDIGRFDPIINTYNDDIDLSFRAQLFGYRCYFASKAKVLHHVSATAGYKSKLNTYLSQRNFEIVWLKNMPAELFFPHFFLHLLHSLISLAKCIFLKQGKDAIKGKIDFLKQIADILDKRNKIQSNRNVNAKYICSLMTWRKKITTFSPNR